MGEKVVPQALHNANTTESYIPMKIHRNLQKNNKVGPKIS